MDTQNLKDENNQHNGYSKSEEHNHFNGYSKLNVIKHKTIKTKSNSNQSDKYFILYKQNTNCLQNSVCSGVKMVKYN